MRSIVFSLIGLPNTYIRIFYISPTKHDYLRHYKAHNTVSETSTWNGYLHSLSSDIIPPYFDCRVYWPLVTEAARESANIIIDNNPPYRNSRAYICTLQSDYQQGG